MFFCKSQALFARLQTANIDAARGAWLALKCLVEELRAFRAFRAEWPSRDIFAKAHRILCPKLESG